MKNLERSPVGFFQARQAEEEIFRIQVAESARPVDLHLAVGSRSPA